MTIRFEVVESKCWRHKNGMTASIYGAVPWTNDKAKDDWQIVVRGFTIRDNRLHTIGCGRMPFKTKEEAQDLCNKWNEEREAKPKDLDKSVNCL